LTKVFDSDIVILRKRKVLAMEFMFGFFAGCFTIIGLIWFAVGTTR
jgi:hypothetical protein